MRGEKCYIGDMKPLFLVVALMSFCAADEAADWSALLPDAGTGVTLDEEAFNRIRVEMQAEQRSLQTSEEETDAALWRRAMNSDSTEERDARLLALLLKLNPELPLSTSLPELVSLLQLHTRAVAGQAAACAELSEAIRCGKWHTWTLPQDAESAAKLLQRCAF